MEISYTKPTYTRVTRDVKTIADLLEVLQERGSLLPLAFDVEIDGQWHRFRAEYVGESTGVRLDG